MTETDRTGQDGMAEALHVLTDETQRLARRELKTALRETWEKAIEVGPALGLLAAGGFCGLLATAASYRFSVRILEKRLPPASAALVAAMGYGAAAAGMTVLGMRRLRELPAPVPSRTVRQAGEAVATMAEAADDPGEPDATEASP